ncbi:MAG: diacylglycerol kinase family protein [Acidimicrobiia bacterium]|jgi:diacylglycerol kinase (ATP)
MKGWIVLVNPEAGLRSVDPFRVRAALTRAGVDGEVVVVRGSADMREAVVEASRTGYGPVVVGGDGTVGLAAEALALAGLPEPPLLGVLPAGSGCDLLRTFGLPSDLQAAAAHLRGDRTYLMDLGVIEGSFGRRVFANIAQAGVGAAAAETAPKVPRSFGSLRYPVAFAARLPRFPRAEVEIRGEHRTHRASALAVIFANGQFFAGGWNIAPKATMVDGLLDVQVISALKRQAPALVPKIIKGVHLGHPSVRRFSLDRLRLETSIPWPVEADGDYLGRTPVEVGVLPGALRLKI